MTTRRQLLSGITAAGIGAAAGISLPAQAQATNDKYWEAQAKIDALELELQELYNHKAAKSLATRLKEKGYQPHGKATLV